MRGRPASGDFIAYCATYGEDRFDFAALPPRVRLEIQYAVQCRVDAQRARAVPRAIKPLLDHLAGVGTPILRVLRRFRTYSLVACIMRQAFAGESAKQKVDSFFVQDIRLSFNEQ